MNKKIYSSYDEINRDLEILRLERKLNYYKVVQSIEDLSDHITLPTLAEGFMSITKTETGTIWSRLLKAATPFLLRNLLKMFYK